MGQKDPDGFHATISIRDDQNLKDGTFQSVHAYTKGKADFTLTKATPAASALPITATTRGNKLIWPQNIKEEAIVYVDPSEDDGK